MFLFSPNKELPGFANAQWADSIPKILQAKLIQSFENYDIAHAPMRSIGRSWSGLPASDRHQKLPNQDGFGCSAEIGFSARILAKDGHVVASRVFLQSRKLDKLDPRPRSRRSMPHSTASQPS